MGDTPVAALVWPGAVLIFSLFSIDYYLVSLLARRLL